MITLPMGCERCGAVRRDHDAPDHRWISPCMDTVRDRAKALKARRAAA
ncbi:hypothetical protein [Micromonospora sp. NPDC005113]